MKYSCFILLSIFVTLVCSSEHFQRVAEDPNLCQGIGYLAWRIPKQHLDTFQNLIKHIPGKIRSKVDSPTEQDPIYGTGLRLSDNLSSMLLKDEGTKFIIFEHFTSPGYSVVLFYQNERLRIAFLVSGKLVGGGKAAWARKRICFKVKEIYENMADILNHGKLKRALNFLEGKCEYDSNSMLDAMISASFGLNHAIKIMIHRYFNTKGRLISIGIKMDKVPSEIEIIENRLVVVKEGVVEFAEHSSKDLAIVVFFWSVFLVSLVGLFFLRVIDVTI
jgi:hypothetical protein